MPRPVKLRCIAQMPQFSYFKPLGVPVSILDKVSLSIEEIEAIRLKDMEGLEQEDSAKKMCISRPTFHRILQSARKKLADALVNGKAIQIEGGNYGFPYSRFTCNEDGHKWNVPFDVMASGGTISCPSCFSVDIQPEYPIPSFGCGRKGSGGFRRGRRHQQSKMREILEENKDNSDA